MSRHFAIMLATVLVATGILVALPLNYVAAGGMVANQSFEEGDGEVPSGWNVTGNVTRVDTGPIYEGNWAVQIAGDGGTLGQWVYIGGANVGLPITYSVWGFIYVSGTVTQVSPTTFLSTGDTNGIYTEVNGQVSAPVAATWARLRLLGTGWENGSEVRFDEIGFYPVTGYCFVATAAYGTETASQLNILREFRDQVLLNSAVGSRFVEAYYRLSPPIADFIARSDFLRALARALLIDPMVSILQWSQGLWGP
jgi:hypothetical protein